MAEHNNQCEKVPKTKSGEGFWTRAVYLANLFGKNTAVTLSAWITSKNGS